MKLPLVIITLWGVALTLGVCGVVTRRKIFLALGMAAALAGVAMTYWLKYLLQKM